MKTNSESCACFETMDGRIPSGRVTFVLEWIKSNLRAEGVYEALESLRCNRATLRRYCCKAVPPKGARLSKNTKKYNAEPPSPGSTHTAGGRKERRRTAEGGAAIAAGTEHHCVLPSRSASCQPPTYMTPFPYIHAKAASRSTSARASVQRSSHDMQDGWGLGILWGDVVFLAYFGAGHLSDSVSVSRGELGSRCHIG